MAMGRRSLMVGGFVVFPMGVMYGVFQVDGHFACRSDALIMEVSGMANFTPNSLSSGLGRSVGGADFLTVKFSSLHNTSSW